MHWKYLIKTSFRGLNANRMRSFLTVLGILIGITSIILLMSIGQGAQNLILGQIQGFGSQTIAVGAGRDPKGISDVAEIYTNSLKEKDAVSLQNPGNVEGVEEISPVVFQTAPVVSENQSVRVNVMGVSEAIMKIFDIYPDAGSFFTGDDVRMRANVAVLGSKTKNDLFGLSDAIGHNIKIKGRIFRVVGILAPKGQVALFDIDSSVVIPYTSAQKYLMGIDYFNAILVRAINESIVSRTVEDIKITLRENHGITDPEKDDFHVHTQEDAVQRVGMITGILTALLVAIAAISLVVGGIGIMNIMLVSITERTREIGLRKALGATNKNILSQFLLESVILTVTGGIAGIIFGTFLSFLTALALNRFLSSSWSFVFPVSAAILGIVVSALVGLVFGIYPARKASHKNPIEALRYE